MGRTYAGILGPLAFSTVLSRALISGSTSLVALQTATLCLFVFAAIGYVAGQIAQTIVSDVVRARFDEELASPDEAAEASASA